MKTRLKAATVLFRFTLVLILAVAATTACASENISGTSYTVDSNLILSGESYLRTNIPGEWENGLDVNTFLGADRFYNAGITGQNTISANVEAGHVWDGHETLLHVSELYTPSASGNCLGDYDRHATWVGMMIGGRTDGVPAQYQGVYNTGIAMDTDLKSGAIASGWSGTPYMSSFSFYYSDMVAAYRHYFGTADVINSSFGGGDEAGVGFVTIAVDALAFTNPTTTMVCAAGNEGPSTNTVGGPASGYNSISVGAMGGANSYDTIASFSSRGPQDYSDPGGTVTGVRAAVDICAPGTSLTSAYYGGTTGGNTGGSDGTGGANDYYSHGLQGTSFAAPIVAGGVALLDSASKANGLNAYSRDGRIIKAVLLNSADKPTGWDNGQTNVGGIVTTNQSLDWTFGAGRMNLNKAYDQYLTGTNDVAGLAGGNIENIGWDYASLSTIGDENDYVFSTMLEGDTILDVTLNWFRDRTINSLGTTVSDNAFADFDLEIWNADFTTLLATSKSDYNNVEHLHFLLPDDGIYGIRVLYDEQRFGNINEVFYGLAWSATAVPEPGQLIMLLSLAASMLVWRRVRR